MNLDKLNPWNWFKHENASLGQGDKIPIARNEIQPLQGNISKTDLNNIANKARVNSLFQLHREMDRLFDNVLHSFVPPRLRAAINRPLLDIADNENSYEFSLNVLG